MMPRIHDTEFDPSSVPPELEEAILRELDGSEKIAWAGRPMAGRLATAELPACFFALFFTAFAATWMTIAYFAGGGFITGFGLIFVAAGLMGVTAPIRAWYRGSRTSYAVTDRRAIVLEPKIGLGHVSFRVQSYPPGGLHEIYRNERGDGSGDLVFQEVVSFDHKNRRRVSRRGFLAIADVREVERLVRSTLKVD